jgi:hypothetical protein
VAAERLAGGSVDLVVEVAAMNYRPITDVWLLARTKLVAAVMVVAGFSNRVRVYSVFERGTV